MQKILVRLPTKKLDIIASLSFLMKLKSLDNVGEVFVITPKGAEIILYIPNEEFRVFTYDDSSENILSIHKYTKNLHDIFNIDIYFDLESTFLSAFMGKSFGARERIGYKKKLNKLFYSKAIEPRFGKSVENYLYLLNSHFEIDEENDVRLNILPKEVLIENFFKADIEELKILFIFENNNLSHELLNDILGTVKSLEGVNPLKITFLNFDSLKDIIIKEIQTSDHLSISFESEISDIYNEFSRSIAVVSNLDWICLLGAKLGLDSFLCTPLLTSYIEEATPDSCLNLIEYDKRFQRFYMNGTLNKNDGTKNIVDLIIKKLNL